MARYIDADKLYDYIQNKAWRQENKRYRYDKGKCDAWYEMLSIIDDQLSVDVETLIIKNKELDLALAGVMHFVDKFLKDEELHLDAIQRAALMRKKVLKQFEKLEGS